MPRFNKVSLGKTLRDLAKDLVLLAGGFVVCLCGITLFFWLFSFPSWGISLAKGTVPMFHGWVWYQFGLGLGFLLMATLIGFVYLIFYIGVATEASIAG